MGHADNQLDTVETVVRSTRGLYTTLGLRLSWAKESWDSTSTKRVQVCSVNGDSVDPVDLDLVLTKMSGAGWSILHFSENFVVLEKEKNEK